jgi:signal transduction histidine kinase
MDSKPKKRSLLEGIRHSLRLKVSLLILLPVLLALFVSTIIEYRLHTERELNSMSLLASQTGRVIEQALEQDMLDSDFEDIQAIIDSIGEDSQFRALYILDRTGDVIFAPTGVDTGLRLDNEEESCQPCHNLPAGERPSGIVVENSFGEQVFRSMHPIEIKPECTECHSPENSTIGLLLTDIAVAPVEEAVLANTRSSLIWWVTALLATAILANLAINRFVLNRLGTLTNAIRNFNPRNSIPILRDTSEDEIGRLSAAFNSMSNRVVKHERENQSLTETLDARNEERGALLKRLINAQEEERKHLAREIHDELGQSLSSIGINVELVQRALETEPEAAEDYLQQVNELISDTTEHMYNLIFGLRPSALDDLGLVAALSAHAQRTLEPLAIKYEINIDSRLERLSPEIETVLFRLFQEGLTNITRHANANHVTLALTLRNGSIEGLIIDDGVGFEPLALRRDHHRDHGYGILGMRERVEQFGGELQIESNPGEGTQLRIRLPIESAIDD